MSQNRSLHSLAADELNPYQSAMTIIAKTLEPFDEDGLIPAIGFGDGELGEGGDVCSCPSPNVSAFSLAPSLIKAMPSLALHSLHIYTLIFRAPLPPPPRSVWPAACPTPTGCLPPLPSHLPSSPPPLQIGDAGALSVARSLPYTHWLQRLDLRSNCIGEQVRGGIEGG